MDARLQTYNDKMVKAIDFLKSDFGTIRAGRANPHVLDKIRVDYYGTPTPIQQVGNVTVPEPRMIQIAPWEKSLIRDIEKAIIKAELGISPNSDGICIRLAFPPLTEERRRDIVKDVKKMGEDAKIAVRNIRRDMADDLKKAEKADNLPEDMVKDNQDKIQKVTDKFTKLVDSLVSDKEKEVMTV